MQLTDTHGHVIHLLLPVPPFLNAGAQRWDALGALLEGWKGGKSVTALFSGAGTRRGAPWLPAAFKLKPHRMLAAPLASGIGDAPLLVIITERKYTWI